MGAAPPVAQTSSRRVECLSKPVLVERGQVHLVESPEIDALTAACQLSTSPITRPPMSVSFL